MKRCNIKKVQNTGNQSESRNRYTQILKYGLNNLRRPNLWSTKIKVFFDSTKKISTPKTQPFKASKE